MYESFEQFTSSPADQKIEKLQYVLKNSFHLRWVTDLHPFKSGHRQDV